MLQDTIRSQPRPAFISCILLLALAGCTRGEAGYFQGYAEGEYVFIAAPAGGNLSHLAVNRGDRVEASTVLFGLDQDSEVAARDEAKARLERAMAQLDNLTKGKRPQEIDVIRAQLAQAEASLSLSETNLLRQQELFAKQLTSQEALDTARTAVERDRARVDELHAQVKTARLGGRVDEIRAAEAEVASSRAALALAEWNLAQKSQKAPRAGMITDTFYRVGEWVAAGRPVVSLLPPENIKIRFFVPEAQLATLKIGQPLSVACDGCPAGLRAKLTFISPEAEYTPPVIFSRETRSKLVFMIEARPDPGQHQLHPGQPVEVRLQS